MAVSLAFGAKLIFEVKTGSSFFVDSGAAKMVPLPLVHVVGSGVGVVFGTCSVWGFRVLGSGFGESIASGSGFPARRTMPATLLTPRSSSGLATLRPCEQRPITPQILTMSPLGP